MFVGKLLNAVCYLTLPFETSKFSVPNVLHMWESFIIVLFHIDYLFFNSICAGFYPLIYLLPVHLPVYQGI